MLIKIIKTNVLMILFVCSVITLDGQDIQTLSPSIPTSPQATAIRRYGDIDINYSTGIPDISLPLYMINDRGYKLPVTLQYYPSPLKPGYNYDVFGYGWGLSVNSCISRTIEYVPDEWRNFNIETQHFSDYYSDCPTCLTNYNYAHDKFNAKLPDGRSFDFVIDRRDGQLAYTISGKQHVKISCSYTTGNIESFTVIDENGVKYTFAGSDTPYQTGGAYNGSYVSWQLTRIDLPYSPEPIIFTYSYNIRNYASTFKEPGIAVVDQVAPSGNYSLVHGSSLHDLPDYQPYTYQMKLLSSINYGNTSIVLVYQNSSSTTTYNYVRRIRIRENSALIREIDLAMSKENVTGYYGTVTVPLAKLDSVTIKGTDSPGSKQVYKCAYNNTSYIFRGTDHWGYLNDYPDNGQVGNLNLFVEFDVDDIPYFFSSGKAMQITKLSQDVCPYDKIKLSTTSFNTRQPATPESHGVLSRLTYPTGGYTDFEFENHKFLTSTDADGSYIYDRDKRVVANAAGFRIKKITNYTLDGHQAGEKDFRYGKAYGEGYDPANGYDSNAENYPNIHTGLGEAVVDPNILTYMNYTYFFPSAYSPFTFPLRNMILGLSPSGEHTAFSNPFNDMYFASEEWKWICSFSALNFRRVLNGRPPVVYPEVTVFYGSIGEGNNYTPEKTVGKTVYRYDIWGHDMAGNIAFFESPRYYGNVLSYESERYHYDNLVEKDDYRFDGQDYALVRKEMDGWSYQTFSSVDYVNTNPYPTDMYPRYANIGTFFTGKTNIIGTSLLSSKYVTTYSDDGDSISRDEGYIYNDRNQLISYQIEGSDGKIVQTGFGYPEISSSGTTPAVVQEMVDQNMISSLLEKTTTVTDVLTGPVVTSGYKTEFKEYQSGSSTLIMPSKSYELERFPSGPEYVMKDQVMSYSPNGNPLEVLTKDGILHSYLWGYNDRYMTAEVINASPAYVYYTSFEDDGTTFTNGDLNMAKTGTKVLNSGTFSFSGKFSPPSTVGLKMSYWYWAGSEWIYSGIVNYNSTITTSGQKLDEIRVFPEDARMTTYSYQPWWALPP